MTTVPLSEFATGRLDGAGAGTLRLGPRAHGVLWRPVNAGIRMTGSTPSGLATCYDLRFPELFRRMIDRGAEFFLVPAGWPYPRLESWTLFNRARANENLAFLFSCNSAGQQGTIHYAGHSIFVDPRGQILAEARDVETILTAEVDIAQAGALRSEFPALEERIWTS